MEPTTASTIQPLPAFERPSELLTLLDNFQQEMHKACGVPSEWTRSQMPGEEWRVVAINLRELERRLWQRMLQSLIETGHLPKQ